MDGNSNRVAALVYGPDSVIVVAGYNKIVPDIDAAVQQRRSMQFVCTVRPHVQKSVNA